MILASNYPSIYILNIITAIIIAIPINIYYLEGIILDLVSIFHPTPISDIFPLLNY